VADAELREELVTAFETEGRDVIATSNGRTLLAFMEELPLPDDFGDDIVVVEDDFHGTHVAEVQSQLRARGWEVPVFTVSTQAPSGRVGVAS
jgi:DNA-binding response OmpR family regulator